jgi:glutamyl-Q tRNA(Asp) synthetase
MIGRFAPTPSGPLHFGSLVTAVASYLDVRSRGGKWLVRIEDIDTPRVVPGSAEDILRTLEGFGFEWDGPVLYQSMRIEAYRAALDELKRGGFAYPCSCSRTTTAPCRCTSGSRWRVRFPGDDFTVVRADGIFAYHLAVVVDDAYQGVTDIVRGADLLDSTPRQMHLQKLLGLPTPRYVHVPVVTNEKGEKLSKQTLAPPLDVNDAPALLRGVLRFLGQPIPPDGDLRSIWNLALELQEVQSDPCGSEVVRETATSDPGRNSGS